MQAENRWLTRYLRHRGHTFVANGGNQRRLTAVRWSDLFSAVAGIALNVMFGARFLSPSFGYS